MASAPTTASRSPETATRTPGSAPHDSRPVVDVNALTTRDDFLLELGQTLGAQAAVRPVESLEEALRSMAGAKRGQVLAIDAREVPDVRAAVDAAQAQVPHAVVLVFADGPAEKELGAALKGRVFAVLAASIEPRKTQAVFAGAVAQALANHPQLAVAEARVSIAEGLRRQAGLAPNPRLILQSENTRFPGSPQFAIPQDHDTYAFLAQTALRFSGKHVRATPIVLSSS